MQYVQENESLLIQMQKKIKRVWITGEKKIEMKKKKKK